MVKEDYFTGFALARIIRWLQVQDPIDLGMGTLIGVVTLGGCFLWLSRISTLEALYGHDDIEGLTLHGQRHRRLSRDPPGESADRDGHKPHGRV